MKATVKIILISGILLMLLFAGCWNDLQKPIAEGNVNITIGTEQPARTLRPNDVTLSAFERFELKFTKGSDTETLTLAQGQTNGTISLETGTWSISALGFIKIGSNEYEAAQGSETVTVTTSHTAGSPANVTIDLKTGTFDGKPGVFSYEIGLPSDITLTTADLSINPFTLETAANPTGGQTVSLLNTAQRSGSFELAPGYYLLTIVAKTNGDIGEKGAAFSELVHIYSGQQTVLNHSFTADDFVDPEQLVSTNSSSTAYTGLLANTTYDIVNLPLEFRENVIKVVPNSGGWAIVRYPLTEYKDKEIIISFSADVKRVGVAGTLNWQVNNNPGYPSVYSINNAAAGTWHAMSGTLTVTPTDANPALYLNQDSDDTIYYVDNFNVTITETVDNVTVTFNANSGSPTPAAIQVVRGESMGDQYPANPTRAGYAFDGWYNGDTLYDRDTLINDDITLTALWAARTSVSSWRGLAVTSGTTAYQYTILKEKTDVLHVIPGTDSAVLTYNLNTYANKEITITLSMEVWLETASKVVWQINQGSYPTVAGSFNDLTAGEWHTVTGSATITVDGTGKTVYLSTQQLGTAEAYITGFAISIKEAAVVTPASAWRGLTVSSGVSGYSYSEFEDKTDVFNINPVSSDWSALTYSLSEYAGKEVTISVSMDVWVEEAVSILWQVNQTGYPTIASGSPAAGQWHKITGSNTVTPASGNVLYLNGGASINGKSIYFANFVVTIQETNPTKTQVTTSWNGLAIPSLTTAYQYSTQHGKTNVLEVIPGDNWATLTRSLASYAGTEITVSVSMDVWLQTASNIIWQANIDTTYPVIAGNYNALSAGEWHTVTGSATITPTSGTNLYLSYDQLGSVTIYLANFYVTISGGTWVDPTTQNTQLSNGQLIAMTWYPDRGSHGEGQALGTLPGMSTSSNEPYHYEVWLEGAAASDNRAGVNDVEFTWYGADQGGGSAFRAQWTKNPSDYLARVGYFWGGNTGPNFNTLKNVYMDFNYTRADTNYQGSGNNTAGNYSYIGVYGWARNPNASVDSEKLIEFYIVEDWFNNGYYSATSPVGADTIMSGKSGTVYYAPSAGSMANVTYQNTGQTFTVNGASYIVYKATRTGPSIAGDTTFTQIFSVRQTMRQTGTISVNEHFDRWTSLTGLQFVNMYDLKFLVESGGGEGWLDLRWLKISQEDSAR